MRVNYIPRLSLNHPQYHAGIPVRGRKQTEIRARSGVSVRDHGRGLSALPLVCYAHAIAITLAGLMELGLLVYPDRQRPSRCDSPVGSCNCSFGACSAFTRVRASTLAQSPSDPPPRKLRQLVASPAASMATGWSEAGPDFHER